MLTGASTGIGREMALLLGARGYYLILVARQEAALKSLAHELNTVYGVTAHVITADLSVPGAVETLLQQILALHVNLVGLVNNAGTGQYGPFINADIAHTTRMMQLNMVAMVELTHALLPIFRQRGYGRILNVGSLLSFFPFPNYAVYAATKAFVLSFSEALHTELEGSGITVSTLAPGPTDTPFTTGDMLKTNAYQGMGMASPADVAKLGIDTMMAGKRLAIHGFLNKVLSLTPGVTPRGITLAINKHMSSIK